MPSPPTLRECGLPAEVSEIPAKTSIGRRAVLMLGLGDSTTMAIVAQLQASDCNSG